MAAEPGHPFFKMVIDDLQSNPPLDPNTDVLSSTGPFFLTRILEQALQSGISVHSPSRKYFNPLVQTPRQYREVIRQGDALWHPSLLRQLARYFLATKNLVPNRENH